MFFLPFFCFYLRTYVLTYLFDFYLLYFHFCYFVVVLAGFLACQLVSCCCWLWHTFARALTELLCAERQQLMAIVQMYLNVLTYPYVYTHTYVHMCLCGFVCNVSYHSHGEKVGRARRRLWYVANAHAQMRRWQFHFN